MTRWLIAIVAAICGVMFLFSYREAPNECRDKLVAAGYDKMLATVQCGQWR